MNDQSLLDTVVVKPRSTPKASVIWLHGLGADGHDFENIVPELHLPDELGARFIFPHAPLRSVTLNAGYVMRAWFDIYALTANAPQDEKGLRASEQAIAALIANENKLGIPSERIILAGFSQGGAVALHCGLRYPQKLAGILGLSAFLPLADQLAPELNPINRNVPIMLAHGTLDPMLPLFIGEHCRDQLQRWGYAVSWHTYPMAHEVCLAEINDVAKWLQQRLS